MHFNNFFIYILTTYHEELSCLSFKFTSVLNFDRTKIVFLKCLEKKLKMLNSYI